MKLLAAVIGIPLALAAAVLNVGGIILVAQRHPEWAIATVALIPIALLLQRQYRD